MPFYMYLHPLNAPASHTCAVRWAQYTTNPAASNWPTLPIDTSAADVRLAEGASPVV